MRRSLLLLAVPLIVLTMVRAQAFDVAFSGYLDARLIAPTGQQSWVKGGQGKFRFGGGDGNVRFVEGVGQVDATLLDGLSARVTARAAPTDSSGVDLLEGYALYAPHTDGEFSWSVKAGAFFPAISLENDDIGWASPYTLTPSAINSWIGEELRIQGSEANLRWNTGMGTLVATGALFCCNDEAGILMADRGWAMDDRPTGLFERVRLPAATTRLFHEPTPTYSGMFDEIDGRIGWYGGLTWQLPDGLGKLSALRYDNRGDPAALTARDAGWETKFWSFGARTRIAGVTVIAQQLSGYTAVVSRGVEQVTKFQSGFLLASYDWDDLRFSLRQDLFQTRKTPAATPSPFVEDGNAVTAALSWNGIDHLRLSAEIIVMDSRRREYTLDGLPAQLGGTQGQLGARYSFD